MSNEHPLMVMVREERERQDITIAEASRRAGIDRSVWWRWENSVNAISADHIPSVCRGLGVQIVISGDRYSMIGRQLTTERLVA